MTTWQSVALGVGWAIVVAAVLEVALRRWG